MAGKIVFLFGAGASKGARHILPCDPPLGAEVYDRLAEHFPGQWGPSSRLGRYSEALRHDFEKTIFNEVCRWNPSLSILEWQRTMALYFAFFIPDSTGKDFYSRLLSFLQQSGKIRSSIFASLNYDCIFEQAADKLELAVDYSCGETQVNAVQVLKIHGSCNFITVDIQKSAPYYLTNPNSSTNCRMHCLQPIGIESVLKSRFSDANASYYPVMSLYSFGKNSIVAGVRIQEIRNSWSECVSEASVVAVIGVRPNSEDTHIWNPIRQTSAKLFYIGSTRDFDIWVSANHHFKFLAKTFEEGFDNLLTSLDF